MTALQFDYEQQARHAVKTALASGTRATPAAMSKVVVNQVANAARATQDQRKAVMMVCFAALRDLHLLGMDLSEITIQILHELSHISLMVRVNPQDVMTWVMEGIAQVAVTAGDPVCIEMAKAIEHEFIGAGAAFSELCEKARGKA